MGVNIQWLKEKDGQIGVFRCGEDFDEFGDPYEMVSVIQRIEDGGAHMFGVQSVLKKQLFKHLKQIRELMKSEDIKYIIWERLQQNGTFKEIRMNIK